MSEYWKSTPKYWCKYCKVFVKDSQFSKEQHDATPRHQGNIQRSLRTMHRESERVDREKQRAKDEVARLDGIVSGAPVPSILKPSITTSSTPSSQVNPADRKRQLAQLAEMGIVVPKEYRAEMAMAGDWETVPQKRIPSLGLKKEDEDSKALNVGVRKRKVDEAEDEDEAEPVVRKGWGTTLKTYPGASDASEDIETLMKGNRPADTTAASATAALKIKREDSEAQETTVAISPDGPVASSENSKQENSPTDDSTTIVFKKRKGKAFKV